MQKDGEPVKYAVGALWGFCPKCGAPGMRRTREDKDTCQNGHNYPSMQAKECSR